VSGLIAVCRGIERVNRAVGKAAAWLALFMVLVQFALVLMRYVFGTGSLFMQESVIYAHAIVFMMAAAWTLADDKHVRVDIFYSVATPRRQAAINLFGVVFFLLPMCVAAVVGRLSLRGPLLVGAGRLARDQRHPGDLPAQDLHPGVHVTWPFRASPWP
jgi:TRAP-type mannitol/chloroaromatic compound transport system permease small subunit